MALLDELHMSMPQRKWLCVVLYFSASTLNSLKPPDTQLMCVSVLPIRFGLQKLLLFVSTSELRCLEKNACCITFVCVYPLKKLAIVAGFARCVSSAAKKRALYTVVKFAHLLEWKNDRRTKETVREGQKYVYIFWNTDTLLTSLVIE